MHARMQDACRNLNFCCNLGEENRSWNVMVLPFSHLQNIQFIFCYSTGLMVNFSALHVVIITSNYRIYDRLMQRGHILWIHTAGSRVNVSAPLRGRLVSWDPAGGFQHHVSMWYDRGKMNHRLKAHTHTVAEAIAWHLLGLDMRARCWNVRAGSKVTVRTDHRNEVYTGTVTHKGC